MSKDRDQKSPVADDDDMDLHGELSTERNGRAEDLVDQAHKKLKAFSLFSSSNKYEDAVELLEKASSLFQGSRNWDRAADCFVEAGEITEKNLKNSLEAAQYYAKGAINFKKFDTKKAIQTYQIAVSIYTENGRHGSAARIYKDMGELHEQDHNSVEARKAYIKAADCYIAEDQKSNANTCRIKVADIFVDEKQFKKAADVYEKCSKDALTTNLGKWSAKDWLYKAALCHFVLNAQKGDMDAMDAILSKYKDMCPSLDGSREFKLIENCLEAFKDEDEEAFTDHVAKHDQIYKMDAFTSNALFLVKSAMENGPTGEGEPDIS